MRAALSTPRSPYYEYENYEDCVFTHENPCYENENYVDCVITHENPCYEDENYMDAKILFILNIVTRPSRSWMN